MNKPSEDDLLLAASRLTGADLELERLQQAIAAQSTAQASGDDRPARESLERVRARFRALYAVLFVKHLGRQRALEALEALQSTSAQRYLAARSAMLPVLSQRLQQLQQQMGNIEI
jgi:hypothetical protein